MKSHAPDGYNCPICLGVRGIENKDTLIKKKDLVYKDELVSAFINSFFVGENKGHVIIVPNTHFENIYDLPNKYAHRISEISKKVAMGMKKSYGCDGITTRQNNEPAGDQHAFHYHFHIFPRYTEDKYNQNSGNKYLAKPSERVKYAEKLRVVLDRM